MAYNHASAFFLIALLLSAPANPAAYGADVTLNGLIVSGQLCCTTTGNCPGQRIDGAVVLLNCNVLGGTTTVGHAITNATGSFNMTVSSLTGLILGLPIVPCVASVRLPLEAVVCPVLSTTTGVLASVVQSVGTVLTSALGLVQNATLTGFIHLTT